MKLWSCIFLLLADPSAFASGLLIPVDPAIPPLAIRSHHVRTEINQQGATTRIEQVFENNTARQLEANYVFPVPRGASVTRFTMLVNGVEKSGEIVEKNQARQIYNSIVSRAQDPGLLEYIGRDLFRANVFPILPNSTQRITVTYIQLAAKERDMIVYTYPLRAGSRRAPTVRESFSLDVSIKSQVPIRSVYSPSHSVMVSRTSETEAEVMFEQSQAALDKDFQLYYSVSDKDVGLNLVTHRPESGKPGYFMLLLSPRSKQPQKTIQRDIVFVVDNSASMAGEKIGQAREALKYCVRSLNDGDRFNIIKFSTDVEPWKQELVDGRAGRDAALSYIETIEPEGGTNMDGALQTALACPRDAARPFIVIFMTDGKPTLGATTDAQQILKNITAAQSSGGKPARIFTWGVGYDLDTHLLDQIAENWGGVSEYVQPKEDIAAKVASFYSKASHPVLTDLKLEPLGEKIQLVNMYPKKLPDLYAGGQLVIFGQYVGEGALAVRLSGQVNAKTEQLVYEMDFPRQEKEHKFIEPLWARRRIGHLLDSIRLHGESPELVQDVIRLSREHGIQTPYTSYLVLENQTQMPIPPAGPPIAEATARLGVRNANEERLRDFAEKASAPRRAGKESRDHYEATPSSAPAPTRAAESLPWQLESKKTGGIAGDKDQGFADAIVSFRQNDGRAGVAVAGYLRGLKRADSPDNRQVPLIQKAGNTRFYSYRELWVDERFEARMTVTQIKFGSEAYFKLLDARPELLEVFKLGTSLLYVTAPGKALAVLPEGEEKLSEKQIEELFNTSTKF